MQSGVVHKPLFAPHFVPVRIELLQLVTIAIRRRIQVTEGGKLQREHVLPVREGQGICISDGLFERQTASNLNRTTRQPKIGQNDRRHVHGVRNRVREKCGRPAEAAKEHLAGCTLEAGAPAGQISAWKPIGSRVTLECRSLRIES